MPFYDYECESCGVFEVQHGMTVDALTECPNCGGKCRRIILEPPMGRVAEDWSTQNNGRGKRIPQMENDIHERRFYKSKNALKDECRKKGYSWDES